MRRETDLIEDVKPLKSRVYGEGVSSEGVEVW